MKPFEDGARVCFVGDSFVRQNEAVRWIIKTYHEQFPEKDIRFYSCGAAGGTYEYALKMFNSDILAYRPTHIVVSYGINDSYRWALSNTKVSKLDIYNYLNRRFKIFKECMEEFCDRVIKNGIELIICTPAPYDEYTLSDTPVLKGCYALMSEYANAVRNFAREKGYTLCDYYEGLVKFMQTETLFVSDHVHPNPRGFYRIAEIFLNHQGIKICEDKNLEEFYPELKNITYIYTGLLTCECMVLQLPEGTDEKEKITAAKAYNGDDKWFISLCKNYIENRPRVKEIFKEIDEIYEKEFKARVNK